MAFSIKVDAAFWEDPKFLSLEADIGSQRAAGACLLAWKLAKSYWLKSKTAIPEKVWNRHRFPEALFEHGFARRQDGLVYVSGTKDFVAAYEQCVAAGVASAEARKKKKPNNNSKTDQRTVERNDERTFQPSHSHLHSHSQKKENTVCNTTSSSQKPEPPAHLPKLQETWLQTKSALGSDSKITAHEQEQICRAIRAYGPEYTDAVLFGARFESATENWDPRKNISIHRVLFGKNKQGTPFHEKLSNLSAQHKPKVWEAVSDAV
jgi:hypothetical protein